MMRGDLLKLRVLHLAEPGALDATRLVAAVDQQGLVDAADKALFDEPLDRALGREVAVVFGNHHGTPGRLRALQDAARVRDGRGERLLDQDTEPGIEALDADVGVGRGRGHDDRGVSLGLAQCLAEFREEARVAGNGLRLLARAGIRLHDAHDLEIRMRARELDPVPPAQPRADLKDLDFHAVAPCYDSVSSPPDPALHRRRRLDTHAREDRWREIQDARRLQRRSGGNTGAGRRDESGPAMRAAARIRRRAIHHPDSLRGDARDRARAIPLYDQVGQLGSSGRRGMRRPPR